MIPVPRYDATPTSGEVVIGDLATRSAFAFSSPTRTMTAKGPLLDLDSSEPEHALYTLRELAASGLGNPCLVGCHPFAEFRGESNWNAPPCLRVAASVSIGSPLSSVAQRSASAASSTRPRVGDSDVVPAVAWHVDPWVERASRERYLRAVEGVLRKIGKHEVRKVVLSRVLDLEPHSADGNARELNALQLAAIVRRVLLNEPARFGFAVRLSGEAQSENTTPGHTGARQDRGASTRWLFGVSPELLLSKSGTTVESFPLAGSAARSCDEAVDAQRAAKLLRSDKDLREHAFVVEAIADTLSPYCRDLAVPDAPELVATSTLWHLGTRITGTLRDSNLSSHALAAALHPTPAVCGTPRLAAKAAIDELEGVSRDYFAGMVGWCDASGDGEWAVTIRCGELTPQRLRLYAGAGVVAGSTPEAELRETDVKLQTLLRAMHVRLTNEAE